MRIIAGRHRGRRLAAPPGRTVRPTSDRARGALFDILVHGRHLAAGGPRLAGALVLDVFAGTGALGLEALSRGAAHAIFMERDRTALAALRANIETCREENRTTVLRVDALRPPPADRSCAIAFLDPPYGGGLAAPALVTLAARGWLAAGAICAVEVGAAERLEPPPGFAPLDERRHGAARLVLLKWRE